MAAVRVVGLRGMPRDHSNARKLVCGPDRSRSNKQKIAPIAAPTDSRPRNGYFFRAFFSGFRLAAAIASCAHGRIAWGDSSASSGGSQ